MPIQALSKCFSNINVNSDIDFCTEYADCFGEMELLKNQFKIQLKSEPVIHAPQSVLIAFKGTFTNEIDRMKQLDIIEEVPILGS